MARSAIWSILGLGTALGLFVWANLRAERLIVVAADEHRCDIVRRGPGWPVPAYEVSRSVQSDGELTVRVALAAPPGGEPQPRTSVWAWVQNGAVGGLLALALLVNLAWTIRSRPTAHQEDERRDRRTYYLPVG